MAGSLFSRLVEPKKQLPDAGRFSDKALRALIYPLLIEQFLQMVVGLADTLMVSYAGESVVSGVSLDNMLTLVFFVVFSAIATGGGIVVAQYIGSGDLHKASHSASQMFFLQSVVSLILTGVMLLLGNSMLSWLFGNVETEVMQACRTYLRIVTISFPANALYNSGAAIYRSMGKTKVTMVISISMNLLNIAGNAIGVFALHAGAAGVAWPTAISWYFAAIVMTVLCTKKNNEAHLKFALFYKPHKEILKTMLRVAIPNSIESGLFQCSKLLLGTVVAAFGTAQIAANGIGQTIWSFASLISVAMGPAIHTVVGQVKGSGNIQETEYYAEKLTRINLVVAFIWNALVIAAMPLLLKAYDVSAETKHLVYTIVVIHNIFAGTVQPFTMSVSAGLRAAGDIKFTTGISLFCTCVIRVALSFLFGVTWNMGVVGITWAMLADWTVRAVVVIIRFYRGKWHDLRII